MQTTAKYWYAILLFILLILTSCQHREATSNKEVGSNIPKEYFHKENPDEEMVSKEIIMTFEDTKILSGYCHQIYYHEGAVHNLDVRWSVTIEKATGHALLLSDILNSGIIDDNINGLNLKLQQYYSNHYERSKDWSLSTISEDSKNFYLVPDGIVFFYMPYEIAAYSEGTIAIKLKYE